MPTYRTGPQPWQGTTHSPFVMSSQSPLISPSSSVPPSDFICSTEQFSLPPQKNVTRPQGKPTDANPQLAECKCWAHRRGRNPSSGTPPTEGQ